MAKATRDVRTLAGIFRAMGEPNRLRLLQALSDGEHNVTELCRKLRLPQPTVSRHLGILRGTGLVTNRRSGKEVYYRLNDGQGRKAVGSLRKTLKDSATVQIGPLVMGLSKAGSK